MAKSIEQPPKWSFLPGLIGEQLDRIRTLALDALNANTPTERYRLQKQMDELYKSVEREMRHYRPLQRRSVVYKTTIEALAELKRNGWVTFDPMARENALVLVRLRDLHKRTALRVFRACAATEWRTVYAAPEYLIELARTTDDHELLNKALRAKTTRNEIVQAAKFIESTRS